MYLVFLAGIPGKTAHPESYGIDNLASPIAEFQEVCSRGGIPTLCLFDGPKSLSIQYPLQTLPATPEGKQHPLQLRRNVRVDGEYGPRGRIDDSRDGRRIVQFK